MKRKVLKVLLITISISISFFVGKNFNNDKKIVEVENVLYESKDDFILDDNEIVIEFSNGSFAIMNDVKKEYTFQPYEVGDWNYSFDNFEDFKNCIETYLNIKREGSF